MLGIHTEPLEWICYWRRWLICRGNEGIAILPQISKKLQFFFFNRVLARGHLDAAVWAAEI